MNSAQGAEALSGLARAFIYAQARALLVSHWEVNSDATVKLITGAMGRLVTDKSTGRASASLIAGLPVALELPLEVITAALRETSLAGWSQPNLNNP